MTNPPDNPAGPPQPPDGPWGPPAPGQRPPQGPPPQGPPPQGPPPQGPPPGWQQPGPPPGWQPPHDQPVWQGHQAPQQAPHGWQPQPPRKRRTALAIGIAVAVLLLAGGAVTAGLLLAADDSDVLAVSDLEKGMCLASSDLASGNSEVDDMTETACDAEHDAQVFAVLEVEEGESFDDAGSRCAAELETDFSTLSEKGVEVRPLAETSEPEVGESVVCFLRNENGAPLTEELV